jgi:hypothetical protein
MQGSLINVHINKALMERNRIEILNASQLSSTAKQ